MDWIRKHPLGAAFGAVLALLVIGILLSSLGRSPSSDAIATSLSETASPQETVTPGTGAETTADRPDLPAVDCSPLLTLAEVEEALGVAGNTDGPIPFEMAQGESCLEQLSDDERFFVVVEPGSPEDFLPGAEWIGVTGDPVTGVGEAALWFGGEQTEFGGGVGVLSVTQPTSLGVLSYRIALGRPDLDSEAQLEIAKTLALSALHRFPGMEAEESEQPEPTRTTFAPVPVDRSDVGFVDNLLAKDEAGEWTLGEGLAETLGLFVGESDPSEVLRHPELADFSGTGVIRLAQEYLETGPNDEARTEIARLLDLLLPSGEQLEARAAVGPSFAGVFRGPSLDVTAQEEDRCAPWGPWFPAEVREGEEPACMLVSDSPQLDAIYGEDKYLLWYPEIAEDSTNVAGWTTDRIDLAKDAMEETAFGYELAGEMPANVEIILTPWRYSYAYTEAGTDVCTVLLNRPAQQLSPDFFLQYVAREMAYCLIPPTFQVGPFAGEWWPDGLATYLSGVEHPQVNVEWRESPGLDLDRILAHQDLATTLLDRSVENWAFFEYLHSQIGRAGVFRVINDLPAALETNVAVAWHPFNLELTDAQISDLGGGTVPYEPPFNPVEIGGPGGMRVQPGEFGMQRFQITVDSDSRACIEYQKRQVQASWRPGRPGKPGGGWSEDLPAELFGESVFVVTGVESVAQLDIDVKKVVDMGDPCEEPPPSDTPGCDPAGLGCEPSQYYTTALGQ